MVQAIQLIPKSDIVMPNQRLVESLEELLSRAQSGQLQSFVGAGFASNGDRVTMWATSHDNVYEMLGSLASLQHEYVNHCSGEDE